MALNYSRPKQGPRGEVQRIKGRPVEADALIKEEAPRRPPVRGFSMRE